MATTYDTHTNKPVKQDTLLSEEYVPKTMPPIAGTLDLTAVFTLIIFFSTNVTTAIQGGAGTFTYWVIGAITFFIPCVIATAQLGAMLPYEGSLYNWTHKAFGGYWSFFVAFCAWFPGILLLIVSANVIVNYIQGLTYDAALNPRWLVPPLQQGAVLVVIVALSGIIAVQRFRTVLNIVKVTLAIAFLAVLILGAAGVVWLLQGHHPATSFSTPTDWGLTLNPKGFQIWALFGFITQAYLGIEVPLNMAGETTNRKVITRHLLWGALLVLAGYFIASFAVLVVLGSTANGNPDGISIIGNPFALVLTVDRVFGPVVGNITAILVMLNFLITPVIYNFSYARLLLAGGIDQRLPVNVGRLNKHRVPGNAIIFQTIVAMIFAAAIYVLVPSLTPADQAATVNFIIYNVVISASTLVWAISTAFLFVNLAKFYISDRKWFLARLIFPMPVLLICMGLGTAACIASIVGTLLQSAIPQFDNTRWFYIVGTITLVCIIIAGIGSMLASSEADWESLGR